MPAGLSPVASGALGMAGGVAASAPVGPGVVVGAVRGNPVGSGAVSSAGVAVLATVGLCSYTAVGTATAVPSGVEVVPEQAIRISRTVRSAGKVNFHTGRLPPPALGRPGSLGFALPSLPVKLELELQRPVLFGEGSL